MTDSADRYALLQQILRDVRPLEGEARHARVEELCGGDSELRAEVQDLLKSLETSRRDAFSETEIGVARESLEEMLEGAGSGESAVGEGAGDVIDRYRLVDVLGEGGMGSVWRAEQSEPVRREVALKIIKLGMDTREVVARFEAERQALAMMDHPHIAKVLDGGATPGGRAYFVMELVEGTPITDFCDQEKLGLQDRLRLFADVCQAMQHAHQRGLIHRDIKPSNVLVTSQDGVASPKVIDFGIAKATDAELTQRTLFTQQAQILGTPAYMAPEQADLQRVDVDTRADVYALGVLLYELLTGTRPFDVQQALEKGFDELLRTIREEDPQRPSTRVSTLKASATEIAANRHADVEVLQSHLRGDLDWIVMKALEKDRSRRYGSATAFADDIERYLSDEPVSAVPPSRIYVIQKLLRRRKKTVIAAAMIVTLFVVGSVGTGVGLWKSQRANRALGLALKEKGEALLEEERQRHLAEENERRATLAERAATARSKELQQVADFRSEELSDLDVELMGIRLRANLLDSVPEERRTDLDRALEPVNFTTQALVALRENLFERTLEGIDTQFEDQPRVKAQLLQAIATTLRELGLLETAKSPQERALAIRREELGNDHVDTIQSMTGAGELLLKLGRAKECEEQYREAYECSLRVLGADHLLTLRSLGNVATAVHALQRFDEAEKLRRKILEDHRRLGFDRGEEAIRVLDGLASSLQEQGRLADAEPYFREALSLSRETLDDGHRDTLIAAHNLGGFLMMRGQFADAEPLLVDAMEKSRRFHGDEHPSTMTTVSTVATNLMNMGRFSESEAYSREVMETRTRVLGEGHHQTVMSMNQMGMVLMSQGRFDDAEPYLRKALETRRRVLGDRHRSTVVAVNNMGGFLKSQGRSEEAAPFLLEALEGCRAVFGPTHPNTLRSLINVGGLLRDQGKLAEAEPFFIEAWEARKKVFGEENPETQLALEVLEELRQLLAEKGD